MDMQRVSRSVRRITILQRDRSGELTGVTVYKRRRSKKKSTPLLRPFEQLTRRVSNAQARSAQSYLSRHARSNKKKKDGWVEDLPANVFKASRKGVKALKLTQPLSF